MKRIILMVTVVLVMAAMMVAMAMPAFADKGGSPSDRGRGFGSEVRKECQSPEGIYLKENDRGEHSQICLIS